jgi:biopolymer transport protein ExbD
MRSRWRKRRQHEPAELNITSFMNLMVILVPFLLITAVFSRMAVIELNLPTAEAVTQQEEPEFALEVIVREDVIEVGDRNAGVLKQFVKAEGHYDLVALTDYLKRVKGNFPDQLSATLLLESDIDYEVLVQVMDAVRTYRIDEPGEFKRAELFPEISIGDAPLVARASR